MEKRELWKLVQIFWVGGRIGGNIQIQCTKYSRSNNLRTQPPFISFVHNTDITIIARVLEMNNTEQILSTSTHSNYCHVRTLNPAK